MNKERMTNDYIYDSLEETYEALEINVQNAYERIRRDGGDEKDEKRADALFKALNSLGDAVYYMKEASDSD